MELNIIQDNLIGSQQSPVEKYLAKFICLTGEDISRVRASFKEVKVKKRQFIVQPNFVASHRNYVAQGSFRAYIVGDSGQEHTIAFAIDGWWITDYNSYIFQKPATMFVVALEDSTVLQIDFERERLLKASDQKFEVFFGTMAERGLVFYERWLILNLSQTAKERYDNFKKTYSLVYKRLPQYVVASFLGISTEYLSRLINQNTSSKE